MTRDADRPCWIHASPGDTQGVALRRRRERPDAVIGEDPRTDAGGAACDTPYRWGGLDAWTPGTLPWSLVLRTGGGHHGVTPSRWDVTALRCGRDGGIVATPCTRGRPHATTLAGRQRWRWRVAHADPPAAGGTSGRSRPALAAAQTRGLSSLWCRPGSRRSAMPLRAPGRGVCATFGAERCLFRSSGPVGPLRPRLAIGDRRRHNDPEPITGAWVAGRGRRQTRERSRPVRL
jgi:hypothetical protein